MELYYRQNSTTKYALPHTAMDPFSGVMMLAVGRRCLIASVINLETLEAKRRASLVTSELNACVRLHCIPFRKCKLFI